jgi:O-antigen ligase
MPYLLRERDDVLRERVRSRALEKQAPAVRITQVKPRDPLRGAFFWLSIFYFVYCARPQDWVPGLQIIPLAKITGILTIASLLLSVGKTERKLSTLPREAYYLLWINALFLISAILSPVWKGGAFFHAVDFLKATVAWILVFLAVTTFKRLRRLVFIQACSVAAVSLVSTIKGHSTPRLEGVLGGIYSNPNELALAIVLSLPFCFAFFLMARDLLRKVVWAGAMVAMLVALLLTASRAGFITLVVAGLVCMWHFAVKGRRPHLIVGGGIIFVGLLVVAGGTLKDRFLAMSGDDLQTGMESRAYGSFEERRYLIMRSIEGIENYPLFGIGMHNFAHYSGVWRDVHVAYLQICVEGGIPVLVLYLSLFWCAFRKLRQLRRKPSAIAEFGLLGGALHSSLIGFIVGASFAPIAYLYYPYFAVAYVAVLFAIVQEQETTEQPVKTGPARNALINRNPVARLEKLWNSSEATSR